jgi:predicted RNase H-like HicB family nuclease
MKKIKIPLFVAITSAIVFLLEMFSFSIGRVIYKIFPCRQDPMNSFPCFGIYDIYAGFIKYAVWKEGKYYVSQCLNVDVSSFGKTKKEALKNLEEALELYFEESKAPKVTKIMDVHIVSGSLKYA